jgi:hypothetical protein
MHLIPDTEAVVSAKDAPDVSGHGNAGRRVRDGGMRQLDLHVIPSPQSCFVVGGSWHHHMAPCEPDSPNLVIRSTGAGLLITAAGQAILVCRSVYNWPIALFTSARLLYHGVRCLSPFDPHQLHASQIIRHSTKCSTSCQEASGGRHPGLRLRHSGAAWGALGYRAWAEFRLVQAQEQCGAARQGTEQPQSTGDYMRFAFSVTENHLTDALFHNISLHSSGNGSKADARAQARAMLAADILLTTCQSVLDSLDRNLADDCLPETKAALHEAIRTALGV